MVEEPGAVLRGKVVAGRYRVGDELGRGGMAVVYEARHVELDRTVALKILRGELARSDKLRRRFMREARAAAKLESDHVAVVLDVGVLDDEIGGLPYIAMERLRGRNLAEHLAKRGSLPVEEAVDLVLQACVAVAEAHARGIVHRDLKPSNLFLAERDDGTVRLKVLDFGIAKAMGAKELDASLTRSQDVFGTPYYMSPEQLRGAAQVDARTDLWSLGVVLYELLTGEVPFGGGTVAEVHAAVLERSAVPLTDHRTDVPPEVERTIRRSLVKSAGERIGTVVELARRIAPFGGEGARSWLKAVERSGASSAPGRVTVPSAGEAPVDTLDTTALPPLAAAQETNTSWDRSTGASRKARPIVIAALALGVLGVVVGGFYALSGEPAPRAPAAPPPPPSSAPIEPSAAPVAAPATPEPSSRPTGDGSRKPVHERAPARATVAPSASEPTVVPPAPPPPTPSPYDERE